MLLAERPPAEGAVAGSYYRYARYDARAEPPVENLIWGAQPRWPGRSWRGAWSTRATF